MHIYEYLFVGLIIVMMLGGSAYMMTTLSSPTSNASEKDQLKITTEKVMIQMLLGAGYPYDWGSTSAVPQVFGLAEYGQTSREAYELDPDKVMRLDSSIANSVSTDLALSLLNLKNEHGAAEYGFTLEFRETLNISLSLPLPPDDTYSITVLTSDYGLPVIGAKVSATLYYINNTQTPPKIGHAATSTLTAYDGSCTLTFGTSIETAKILAVTVDFYGAHATNFFQITPGPTATLFQNGLIPNPSQPYSLPNGADSREIILTHNDEGYKTNDFAVQNTGTSTNFVLSVPPEFSAVAVIAISGTQGDTLLLASRDFSQFTFQTIDFQDPNVHSASFAYSIDRTVFIGGTTYNAKLYLWRMSV
jgi:hypothetical protein